MIEKAKEFMKRFEERGEGNWENKRTCNVKMEIEKSVQNISYGVQV